jgi:hypothetical protein
MLPFSTDIYDGQFLVANLAQIYLINGQYDESIEQLNILLASPGFTSVTYLETDPIWSGLWGNGKFNSLLGRYR